MLVSADIGQAKECELGLDQIGYGHGVNMYACTSVYALLLQCLCCLLLSLCILVSAVVFLCLSCLLVSCMSLCILMFVVLFLCLVCLLAVCLFVLSCVNHECACACIVCLLVCAVMCDSCSCLCLYSRSCSYACPW